MPSLYVHCWLLGKIETIVTFTALAILASIAAVANSLPTRRIMSTGGVKRSLSILATSPSSSKPRKTKDQAREHTKRGVTFEGIDLINDYVSNKQINFTEAETTLCRSKLISWYHINRRKLPWRGDAVPNHPTPPSPSPYGTWVSEVFAESWIDA